MSRSKESTNEEVTVKKEARMGLEFYLQQNPQEFTIAELLRSKYKMSVMTKTEWDETLKALMAKKVIS